MHGIRHQVAIQYEITFNIFQGAFSLLLHIITEANPPKVIYSFCQFRLLFLSQTYQKLTFLIQIVRGRRKGFNNSVFAIYYFFILFWGGLLQIKKNKHH